MGIMSNKHKTSVQGKQIATWNGSGSAVYDYKTGKLGKAESGQERRESSLPDRIKSHQMFRGATYKHWRIF